MLRHRSPAHDWFRLILLAAGVLLPTAARAQVVHNPEQPSRPGERVRWVLELPPDWNVETVTFDPLGFGLDTFVQRAYRQTLGCPGPTECWSATVFLDDRLQPGERSVTFTAFGGGRSRTVTGRLRVDAPADDDRDGMPDVWERREGLEPFDRLGTSAPGDDPDGDGVANIDELRDGTAPMGRYRLLFGSSSAGDRQQMAPGIQAIQADSLPGKVRVRFIGDGGRQIIAPDYSEGPEIAGGAMLLGEGGSVADRVLAVEVDSFQPIAAERDSGFEHRVPPERHTTLDGVGGLALRDGAVEQPRGRLPAGVQPRHDAGHDDLHLLPRDRRGAGGQRARAGAGAEHDLGSTPTRARCPAATSPSPSTPTRRS